MVLLNSNNFCHTGYTITADRNSLMSNCYEACTSQESKRVGVQEGWMQLTSSGSTVTPSRVVSGLVWNMNPTNSHLGYNCFHAKIHVRPHKTMSIKDLQDELCLPFLQAGSEWSLSTPIGWSELHKLWPPTFGCDLTWPHLKTKVTITLLYNPQWPGDLLTLQSHWRDKRGSGESTTELVSKGNWELHTWQSIQQHFCSL